MSVDSLTNDFEKAVDDGVRLDNSQHQLDSPKKLPYIAAVDLLNRSEEILNRAKHSLTNEIPISLDHRSFVRFLADASIPIVPEFKRGAFLGSGWTMSVYRGECSLKGTPRPVAVKQLNVDLALGMSSEDERTKDFRAKLASVLLEIRLMSHELLKSHVNIVRLLGISWTQQKLKLTEKPFTIPVLLVELASILDGLPLTLELFIESSKIEPVSLETKMKLLADVASGLGALSALSVVHGDMKPSNVLIFQGHSGPTAKISDFGFCISGDEELQAARGGTPLWNAPECLKEAPEDIGAQKHKSTRDYYSFGLLIWFVLFEVVPFIDRLDQLDNLKMKATLKDEIDAMFATRYRLRAGGHGSDGTTLYQQEQFDTRTGKWQACSMNEQHILRFLMQWVLVLPPQARRNTFEMYGPLLRDKVFLNIAKQTFESPGAWDLEWNEFGRPNIRVHMGWSAEKYRASRGTLYYVETDIEFIDWGMLRQFETPSSGQKIQKLAGKTIPAELRHEIFEGALQSSRNPNLEHISSHQKMVGDCYSIGFGVQQNVSQALLWYEKAANNGNVEAAEAFLRVLGPTASLAHFGENSYCQWLGRVLLSAFGQGPDEYGASSNLQGPLARLAELFWAKPELARVPLERAFETFINTERISTPFMSITDSTTVKMEWLEAVQAIQEDDEEALRKIITAAPSILQGHGDGRRTLLYVAAECDRAGLLRMLIDEYHIDLKVPSTDGITPLAQAVRLGNTASVRVLLFSDKQAKLEGDIAAMDSAAEGPGDLTRVLFDKFAGPKALPGQNYIPAGTGPTPGIFGRWSFFSLASAILNNNWVVLCTLLAIGINPDTTTLPELSGAETFFAATLLASTSYNPVMLATVLAFGASAHMRIPSPDYRTALHLACGRHFSLESAWDSDNERPDFTRHWRMSRINVPQNDLHSFQKFSIWLLEECGADLEARDGDGRTPLAYSLQLGVDLVAASFLLGGDTRVDIDNVDFSGRTVLHRAVAQETDATRVDFCLHHGATVDAQTILGETPLVLAVKNGHTAMCKRLLNAGANIRARDVNGQNCLHLALWHSKLDILHLFETVLLSHSRHALEETILNQDCRGWSTLHTCIMKSATDSVFVPIFERWVTSFENFDLDVQDALGRTLLHTACSNSLDCARILLEQGASVDIKDTILGWTPLHHACNEGGEDMWNLLLSYEADFFLRDDLMGWTPMTVLEQAMDSLRIDSGERWVDEDDNPIQDDVVWEDEAEEDEHGDSESEHIDPIKRQSLAWRRVKVRNRITLFFARESMRRIARPARQADIDREEEFEREKTFPSHHLLEEQSSEIDGPARIWNTRNLARRCVVDCRGRIRSRTVMLPASTDLTPYRIWLADAHGTISGIAGVV